MARASTRRSTSRYSLTDAKWNRIKAKNAKGCDIEGTVAQCRPGSYSIRLGSMAVCVGTLPQHEVEWAHRNGHRDSPSLALGEYVRAVVDDYDDRTRTVKLTLQGLYDGVLKDFFSSTKIGEIVTGVVSNQISGGAFVELQYGAAGFLPTSELQDYEAGQAIENLLQRGDSIAAVVTAKDESTRRFTLSVKELIANGPSLAEYLTHVRHNGAKSKPTLTNIPLLMGPEKCVNPRRVIVIEDDDVIREHTCEMLRACGHDVESVDGIAALKERFAERIYDCIVADVMLAGGERSVSTVVDLLQKCRGCKALFVAGEYSPEDLILIRSVAGRVLNALIKPASFREIAHAVDRLEVADSFEVDAFQSTHDSSMQDANPLEANIVKPKPTITRSSATQLLFEEVGSTIPSCGIALIKLGESIPASTVEKCLGIRDQDLVNLRYQWQYSPIGDVLRGTEVVDSHLSTTNEGRSGKILPRIRMKAFYGCPVTVHDAVEYAVCVFNFESSEFDEDDIKRIKLSIARYQLCLEEIRRFDRLEKDQAKAMTSKLLMSMAHEMRNDLYKMNGPIQTLQRILTDTSPEAPVKAISEDCLRLLAILAKAYESSSAEFKLFLSIAAEKRSRSTNIYAVIDQLTTFFQFEATRREIDLTNRLAPELSRFECNETIIRSVFCNLIINALDHTRRGGAILLVGECDSNSESESISIRVIDSGAGIHASSRERVFDAYYTTRGDGTGLGLYISRSLARSIGAEIAIESSYVYYGTSMLVKLPAEGSNAIAQPII